MFANPRPRSHTPYQIVGIRVLLWVLSFMVRMDHVTWDDAIINGLAFVEDHVLQVPLFLMALMRYVTPTLDIMYVRDGRGRAMSWPSMMTRNDRFVMC